MLALIDWVNAKLDDPVEWAPPAIAGIVHYNIVEVHPFADGNGRTARLLTAALLMKAGYAPYRLFNFDAHYGKDKDAYLAALRSVRQQTLSQETWIQYFLDGLASEYERVAGEVDRLSVIGRTANGQKLQLSDSQQKGLTDLKIRNIDEFSRREYEAAASVSRNTAQKDLNTLSDSGVLNRVGDGSKRRYRLPTPRRPIRGAAAAADGVASGPTTGSSRGCVRSSVTTPRSPLSRRSETPTRRRCTARSIATAAAPSGPSGWASRLLSVAASADADDRHEHDDTHVVGVETVMTMIIVAIVVVLVVVVAKSSQPARSLRGRAARARAARRGSAAGAARGTRRESSDARLSPLRSPRPLKRRCRAKARRTHNPRVGGSSPSSGITPYGQIPRRRAETRGIKVGRSNLSEPLPTPSGACVPVPRIAPGASFKAAAARCRAGNVGRWSTRASPRHRPSATETVR